MKNLQNLEPISKNKLSLFEIEHPEGSGEYNVYHNAHNEKYIAVGSVTNTGFLTDFYIKKDDAFTIDQHLEAIHELIVESLINNEELSGLIEL